MDVISKIAIARDRFESSTGKLPTRVIVHFSLLHDLFKSYLDMCDMTEIEADHALERMCNMNSPLDVECYGMKVVRTPDRLSDTGIMVVG